MSAFEVRSALYIAMPLNTSPPFEFILTSILSYCACRAISSLTTRPLSTFWPSPTSPYSSMATSPSPGIVLKNFISRSVFKFPLAKFYKNPSACKPCFYSVVS